MAAAPTPDAARPATFDDLPEDVLSVVLSKLDFHDRFARAAKVCKSLRGASRPPSLAWTDVYADCGLADTPERAGSWADLQRDLEAAATSIRRLQLAHFRAPDNPDMDKAWLRANVPSFRGAEAVLAAACPFLEEMTIALNGNAAYLDEPLATAARLTRLAVLTLTSATRSTWGDRVGRIDHFRAPRMTDVAVVGLPGLAPDIEAVREMLYLATRAESDPPERPSIMDTPTLEGREDGEKGESEIVRLHRAVCAAVPRPVVLTSLGWVRIGQEVRPGLTRGHVANRNVSSQGEADLRAFTAALGSHLTRLGAVVDTMPDYHPAPTAALAALVGGLSRLAVLNVTTDDPWLGDRPRAGTTRLLGFPPDTHPPPGPAVALDLSGLPPGSAPRLTHVALRARTGDLGGDFRLPSALAGRLARLEIGPARAALAHPPRCLHAVGSGCGPWSRLARLEYVGPLAGNGVWGKAVNLAAWGTPSFALPALTSLVVWSAASFTVDAFGGGDPGAWAEAVARLLPSLAKLELVSEGRSAAAAAAFGVGEEEVRRLMSEMAEAVKNDTTEDAPPASAAALLFSCRVERDATTAGPPPPQDGGIPEYRCDGCGACLCAGAKAVHDAVMAVLPAAAADQGRRLEVCVRVSGDGGFQAECNERPVGSHMARPALGYEVVG